MKPSAPIILLSAICLLLGTALFWPGVARRHAGSAGAPPRRGADVLSDDDLFSAPLPIPAHPPPATRPAALDRIVREVNFDRAPLQAAVKDIADSAKVQLHADWPRLRETANIDPDAPITLRLTRVTHANALAAVLRDAPGLSYRVDADGLVHIIPADEPPEVSIRFYDIRPLLRDSIAFSAAVKRLSPQPRPLAPAPLPEPPATTPAAGGVFGGWPDDHLAPVEDLLITELSTLILELIDRESWVENGGRYGQVHYWAGRLIVTQTDDNHRQVAELLKSLGFNTDRAR